ncbi:uncharacterized protein LOC119084338 [Bradysia coprophila]|uniref:uncharacterized protein LOC119084338 n=1 Tax=Bradysia coprophila TaxID=38358 RepID=UPI00187D7E9D|nr:uncharacterized protein LOC119084338 [Bradysia coprophila]
MIGTFTLFSILQILLTTCLVSARVVPKGFSHIGSFRTSRTDEENYYISSNKLQWPSAQQSCKTLFGTNSSTVSVNTVEEWNYLKSIIEVYDVGSTYWTAGMYDRNSNVWRWASDNSILPSWAPWDTNHPVSNPSALHRVLIAHTNHNVAPWRTVSNSQLHRFICEVPYSSPIPVLCLDMDLVIVLDSSASIGSHNYKKAKNFVAELVAEFTNNDANRIAFLIYSDTATSVIELGNTLTPAQISTAIRDAPYLKGSTATHIAIEQAIEQFKSSPRNNIAKNVVVVTDGESTNAALTAAAVKTATDLGIRTYSVGVTPSADEDELLVIGAGQNDYVFTTDECDKLISLVEPVARKICPDDD